MVKKCITCKEKYASFNYEGEKGDYCKGCSKPGMINVCKTLCIKCKIKKPHYGFADTKGTHCANCKEDGMYNVNSKMCIKCEKVLPTYGFVIKKPTHCAGCKEDGMFNVKNKMCIVCNNHEPYFGNIDGQATHCNGCKEPDMINVRETRSCIVCDKPRPLYGFEKGKATHCGDCKEEHMINVMTKLCEVCDLVQPTYGNIKYKATHCFNCKTDDMINVKAETCLREDCDTFPSNSIYQGYCAWCFANIYPDSPIIKNHKTKEKKVVDFIRSCFPDCDWKFDIIIKGGKSRRRPDIFLDMGDYYIIIEIDENQHKKYDCTCNNRRTMELSFDVNHKPIVFIRFNPDEYIDENNKKIGSCFSINKETGALKINNYPKWNARLDVLKDTVEYWLNNMSDKTVEVIELFYNQNY